MSPIDRSTILDLDVTLIVQTSEPRSLSLSAPSPVLTIQSVPEVVVAAGHQGQKGNPGKDGIGSIDPAYLRGLFAGLVNEEELALLRADIPRLRPGDAPTEENFNKAAQALAAKFDLFTEILLASRGEEQQDTPSPALP